MSLSLMVGTTVKASAKQFRAQAGGGLGVTGFSLVFSFVGHHVPLRLEFRGH